MTSIKVLMGALGMALACSACGGGDDDNGGGSGTVTAAWSSFCTGTFTKDYDVIEFNEKRFTARAGEEYLLGRYSGAQAEMIYLHRAGPETFEVSATTMAELPFTTTCSPTTAISHYAVFNDVSVFQDEALTNKLCDLKAGTARPLTNAPSGYSAVDFNISGPSTFEVQLNVFSAECKGAAAGYISVPQTNSVAANTRTWLPPLATVLAPP